MMEAD